MKTEPGLQCGSVTDNAISFHEHACEKVPITVEMNVHTHRPQSWDQHPGEARHTQATVVGPAPGGSTSHTGHSYGSSTRGKHVFPAPTVPSCPLQPLPPPGSYHPDFTESFLPLTMIFPHFPNSL